MAGYDALLDALDVYARRAVGRVAGLVDLGDALRQLRIGLRPGAGRALEPVIVATGGHAQDAAKAARGKVGLVRLYEFVDVMEKRPQARRHRDRRVRGLHHRHIAQIAGSIDCAYLALASTSTRKL